MKKFKRIQYRIPIVLLLLNCYVTLSQQVKAFKADKNNKHAYYTAADFSSVRKFDSHVHFNQEDTSFLSQAKADNFRLLTINVETDYYPPILQQRNIGSNLAKTFPDQISFATTFSIKDWGTASWQEQALQYLEQSFKEGAIAVKLWKNIGMVLRDKDGKFVMIDDPRFDVVLNYIAKSGVTLVGHFGEPKNCWLPVDKMTTGNNKKYFSEHPEYHMYLHPDYPSYNQHINARDRMLAKHPDLTFVGAHLGSLEWSVDELAKRLDKYPNMAVDIAARISDLQYQAVRHWKKVRHFMIKYQDRLIYGTDLQAGGPASSAERNRSAHQTWLAHWKFFTTKEAMQVSQVEKKFNGLMLPRGVIDKLYYANAQRWILREK